MNKNIATDVKKIIKHLGLVSLESEGGLYAEVYRSEEFTDGDSLLKRYGSKRCLYTSIYYLITENNFSRLHKIKSDEIYHFYLGDPVEMINLFSDGSCKMVILGRDMFAGEKVQHLVKRDVWQGAKLKSGGSFALLGTTVSPGFEFEDFISWTKYKDEIMQKYGSIKSQIIDYF